MTIILILIIKLITNYYKIIIYWLINDLMHTLPSLDPHCLCLLDSIHVAYCYGGKRKFFEGNWIRAQRNNDGRSVPFLIEMTNVIYRHYQRDSERDYPKYSVKITHSVLKHLYPKIAYKINTYNYI